MDSPLRPIFLFADSQLLFWQTETGLFLRRVRDSLAEAEPGAERRAAYIGASNGDDPIFYELFVGAMAGIDITDCRLIPTVPSDDDRAFLAAADLILLAGGDPWRGWEALQASGLNSSLIEQYVRGALLIGVSAGAMQLGQVGWRAPQPKAGDRFDTLRLVPLVIDAHDEPQWRSLQHVVRAGGEHARGIGLPMGGGAIYHSDGSIEPIRLPLTEFMMTDDGLRDALLLPPDPALEHSGNGSAELA